MNESIDENEAAIAALMAKLGGAPASLVWTTEISKFHGGELHVLTATSGAEKRALAGKSKELVARSVRRHLERA